ncbi:rho guanine nucleotide exchange factor 2-like [Heteronotia binoei]|uniref:rho guanine nucleotide exchange factor 2-like n=1 Tax=Heteronotia binoei TaxID=13085 RepID=UPI0029316F9E|nr:rho guanine nucleotide exchange factor 2-like [Heteronotia binoei]
MGSSLSVEQQAFSQDLLFLLTKEGHSVTKKEVEDLVKAIDDVCPWVPERGTLKLKDWVKIGGHFQDHPRVTARVLFTWPKIRACLKGLTPNNILFNQQMEAHPSPMASLPRLLPPASAPPFAPSLKTDERHFASRKPPDDHDMDTEDPGFPLAPVIQPDRSAAFAAAVSAAVLEEGDITNKEKERMKEKEKDARYTNGHLFTSITVSGMTMCFACNKSITAKEALSCPNCNVTIHNRCKDTLPNCTKVKQKHQKAALLKNNSALQSVSLRNKTTIRERPSSAIYPSESFRQTLLGSRRGRPTLSLSKSVSTTNIAGTFNDESPLGIRRILSQSTDSLNMRNRTLSVESLIDEGAEVIYSQLMSDFEMGEKDFEADSWSLAVDNNFLQQQQEGGHETTRCHL